MRPISLEMEGFTSFRQRAAIDFSKFDLFAITGPTGAGKTSIIDAMIYVLYGCTPRISNKSIRELISQGADRLKVMLVFSSGQDQYRIARETKWTGKSSLTSVRLEHKNGDDWTSLADRVNDAESSIEKIIGLDFKGFTKSVVLPQGQFDEFLKGRPEDRRKILSDLLQLDVYGRMMQRANEIAKDHKNRLDALAGLLSRDYANATRENLSGLRKELKELKPLVKPLDSQLRSIRAAISVALQFRQNRSELAKAEAELKNLGPARSSAEKRLARAQQVINESKRKLEAIDVKINATTYDSPLRDGLIAKLHKSERLHVVDGMISELEGTQKKKSRRSAELELLNKKAQAAYEVATKERSSVDKELAADKLRLRAALSKYGSYDAIAGIIEVNRRRIKDEQQKTRIETELERLIRDRQARTEKLSAVKKDLTRAEKQLSAARIELELLAQQHAAAELKGALEEGKPCPVCEQDVKRVPKAKRHPSIEQARKSVQTYEQEVNDFLRTTSTLGGELRQIDPRLTGKKREIGETETRISEAMEQVRVLLGKAPGLDAEEKLEALRDHVLSLQEKLDETVGRLDERREKEATAKDEAAQLKRDLSVTKSEVSGALQQLARLQSESKALRKELGRYSDLSVVKADLKRQNDAKKKFEEDRRRRESESEVLSKAKDEFADSSKLREGLTAKENALKRSCEKLALTVNQNRESLGSDFPDLKIDALGPDRDSAAQLEQRFQDLESRRNATQKELQRLEQLIKTLEGQIERATLMRHEMEMHKAQAAFAHDLAQTLRGDQFIAFIQEEAYQRLAIDGSVHLKSLSSDRYSFDFDKDEFVAVDHWNADEPRPVTTLSGGESFLASLALALALAEGLSGLSHGRSRFALESLFLDEGFGTLDPETLDVVLQGIETLGTSDRLVGIVSHIPELADRMPSRIHVRKAIGGSSIEIS
jgi:exonuclease SbcC